eukprot:1755277-Prymnesium_polylepis.1
MVQRHCEVMRPSHPSVRCRHSGRTRRLAAPAHTRQTCESAALICLSHRRDASRLYSRSRWTSAPACSRSRASTSPARACDSCGVRTAGRPAGARGDGNSSASRDSKLGTESCERSTRPLVLV